MPGVTPDQDHYTINNDPNRTEEFDDIVKWVTIDELRVKIGCPGAQLRIITTELPIARQGESYCATILVEGGVPFPSGGKYEWSYDKDYSLVGIIFTQNNTKADLFTINGTPRCPGSYRISVTVTDNQTNIASRTFTLVVQPNPIITSPSPATPLIAYNSSRFDLTITASGGVEICMCRTAILALVEGLIVLTLLVFYHLPLAISLVAMAVVEVVEDWEHLHVV